MGAICPKDLTIQTHRVGQGEGCGDRPWPWGAKTNEFALSEDPASGNRYDAVVFFSPRLIELRPQLRCSRIYEYRRFDSSEPESYRRDVPNTEVHIVDGGHFALDTAADEIAALIGQFMKTQK